jgi:hypothetical protein
MEFGGASLLVKLRGHYCPQFHTLTCPQTLRRGLSVCGLGSIQVILAVLLIPFFKLVGVSVAEPRIKLQRRIFRVVGFREYSP